MNSKSFSYCATSASLAIGDYFEMLFRSEVLLSMCVTCNLLLSYDHDIICCEFWESRIIFCKELIEKFIKPSLVSKFKLSMTRETRVNEGAGYSRISDG